MPAVSHKTELYARNLEDTKAFSCRGEDLKALSYLDLFHLVSRSGLLSVSVR
jgi:hypothetical protein